MRSVGWLRLTVAALGLTLPLTLRANAQTSAGAPAAPTAPTTQSAGHEHEKATEKPTPASPPKDLPSFIAQLRDEDRKAAFPDVEGHAVHDQALHSFVLLDQFEWQAASEGGTISLDSKGWIGRDRNRLWFRAEADAQQGRIADAQTHILYGRQFSRWWDIVAGIRQDFKPGPQQTWAVVGIQGLAPYRFEIEASAYVGASGRTHARCKVEYELLLTNRLVLQPLVEAEIYGKSDSERGVGAGLSTTESGFRLRYEIRREVAPYFGVVWSNTWGRTADFAKAAGEDTGGARWVTGMRLWF